MLVSTKNLEVSNFDKTFPLSHYLTFNKMLEKLTGKDCVIEGAVHVLVTANSTSGRLKRLCHFFKANFQFPPIKTPSLKMLSYT